MCRSGFRALRRGVGFALAVAGALVLVGSVARAGQVDLVILHTTDIHGRVANLVSEAGSEPADGGWLRLATRIREARADAEHVLLLDAGDTLQGSPESHATLGREMVEALDRLGYDAWAIGNHEFDWGLSNLGDLLEGRSAVPLAANLHVAKGIEHPLPQVRPYILRTVGGVRVAVVGLTTPGLPRWFLPELIGPLQARDSMETLRALMPELRAEDPDLRILVLHQGFRGGATDHANQAAAILRRFPEFDVVIGGHSHQFVPGILVNGVLYAQAGYHGATLGRIDLRFDRQSRRVIHKTGRLVPVGRDVPEDPAEAAAWAARIADTRARLDAEVGRLSEPLSPRADHPGQSGIERLLRAAIAEAVEADLVIHGALSAAGLDAGPITERDLWRIVPYENRIGIAHLTLREVREILEEVLAQPRSPRFMGVSGLLVEIRPAAPAGRRVGRMRLADGRPAHGRRRYRVAFNSYTLASAGGRFPRLRQIALRRLSRFEWTDVDTRDALRAYVASRPDAGLHEPPADGYRTVD